MALSLTGGQTRQLVPCVKGIAFDAGPQGVYYVRCGPSADSPLHLIDPATGEDRLLGTLEALSWRPLGLAVTPDGRSVLYPRQMGDGADLMLIENFR